MLSRHQGVPVGTIVVALGLRQPDVSKHLGVLRKAGIVSVSKQGQHRVYVLNFDRLRPVYDWVKAFERHWERQLDRIRARAEERARALASATGQSTGKKGKS
jgi:DNA-binding transcriptional ArsR family regulator